MSTKYDMKFLVYPIEIHQFIRMVEAMKRQLFTEIRYNFDARIFICDVGFAEESDAVEFQELFVVFFKVSTYVSR